MTGREIGVVFVNHESQESVAPRATMLRANGFAVVVVDNSGGFEALPGIAIVDSGRNLGFGVGCNLGVAALPQTVEVICLHNPDVDATPDSLRALAHRIDDGLVAAAPAVETRGQLRRRGYHYPSVSREMFVAWRATRPTSRSNASFDGTLKASRVRTRVGSRFGSAALLALDRAAYASVGGFDPAYFLYGEDLDLWHRLRLAGGDVGFAPDLVVRHTGAAGSRLGAGSREVLRWLGVELFASRHQPSGWRPYRAVHRRLLSRARPDPDLVDLIEAGFERGSGPDELLLAVRRHYESRVPAALTAQSTLSARAGAPGMSSMR